MRTFRIKQVKDGQDEDELSAPDDTRRSRESPPTIPGGSDERSESSANRGNGVHARRGNLQSGASPRKIPCVQFAVLAPNESGLVSSETHIDRKKPRNESQRHNLIKSKEMASIFSRIIAGEIPSYKVAEDKKLLCIPRHQSAYERTHARGSETGSGLYFRPRRPDAGRHDGIRQAGGGPNQARNSVRKGSRSRIGHGSTSCAHPSDPDSERKRRGFSPGKLRLTPEEFREIAESWPGKPEFTKYNSFLSGI